MADEEDLYNSTEMVSNNSVVSLMGLESASSSVADSDAMSVVADVDENAHLALKTNLEHLLNDEEDYPVNTFKTIITTITTSEKDDTVLSAVLIYIIPLVKKYALNQSDYELKCQVLTFLNLFSFEQEFLKNYNHCATLATWLIELLKQRTSDYDDRAFVEICDGLFCLASSNHCKDLLICGKLFENLNEQMSVIATAKAHRRVVRLVEILFREPQTLVLDFSLDWGPLFAELICSLLSCDLCHDEKCGTYLLVLDIIADCSDWMPKKLKGYFFARERMIVALMKPTRIGATTEVSTRILSVIQLFGIDNAIPAVLSGLVGCLFRKSPLVHLEAVKYLLRETTRSKNLDTSFRQDFANHDISIHLFTLLKTTDADTDFGVHATMVLALCMGEFSYDRLHHLTSLGLGVYVAEVAIRYKNPDFSDNAMQEMRTILENAPILVHAILVESISTEIWIKLRKAAIKDGLKSNAYAVSELKSKFGH